MSDVRCPLSDVRRMAVAIEAVSTRGAAARRSQSKYVPRMGLATWPRKASMQVQYASEAPRAPRVCKYAWRSHVRSYIC